MIKENELRCNVKKDVCKECFTYKINCKDAKKCQPVKHKLRDYYGIRLTADGFDCALPVSIDSHSNCAYECLYCFSDNILSHKVRNQQVGQTSLIAIESLFRGDKTSTNNGYLKALKYDKRNKSGYPCAVQLGGLCDAGDSIEQNQGWLLKFIELAIKYNQPVRMSTKSAIFKLPEYLNAIKKAPHLFWVAFSIICNDDSLMEKIDLYAPNTTQRIETMKMLSDIGVKTSLRLRPIMYGITDKNKGYEKLIRRSAKAGAIAISYETGFYPLAIPRANKWKWQLLNRYSGTDLSKIYFSFGKKMACTRPSYLWTEEIMHRIKEIALEEGLTVGVSDPAWKQLTDTGCCCGIKEDDKVFGNWERENATLMMLRAKKEGCLIYLKDITPPWAYTVKEAGMVYSGVGPKVLFQTKHKTWADSLKENWNTPSAQRSPLNYFQGAWQIHKDNFEKPILDSEGNLIYKYIELNRNFKKTGWNV